MERYRLDECTQAILESSVVPVGVYQLVDGRATMLFASDSLCSLFGFQSRSEAQAKMDGSMFGDVHPDDLQSVGAATTALVTEGQPCSVACRIKTAGGFEPIRVRGELITTSTGARLAVVWYVNESESPQSSRPQRAQTTDEQENAVYESIIDALAGDYFDLYYVDVETDEYMEYGSRTRANRRTAGRCGTDFFAECKKNAPGYVYEEDLERVEAALEKQKLLSEIRRHGSYIYNYRLLIDGAPTYVSMKATSAAGDHRHVIIGVSNVDTQVKDRMVAQRATEERKSYLRLSALIGNLIVLYFVDPENEHCTEFRSSKGYGELGIAKQGTDFFQTTYKNSLRLVHPKDQEMFHAQFTKENVLSAVRTGGTFVIDYRLTV